MKKNVLVISSSLRSGSNSELLAKAAMDGAAAAGHPAAWLSLKDKTIGFCKGCLACQNTGNCVIRDDMDDMIGQVRDGLPMNFESQICRKIQKHLTMAQCLVRCFCVQS